MKGNNIWIRYVGLVSAHALADVGNEVVCVDIEQR